MHLQLVSVLTSIERWTDELHSFLRFRLRHLGGVVRDLPYKRARVIQRQLTDRRFQAGYLMLLLRHETTHET